jgi:hypothetical protein
MKQFRIMPYVWCMVYTILYTLYTVHCTLYTIHYTPYTIRHTPVHHAPCTMHHTPYTAHCTLYTIQYTPYTICTTTPPAAELHVLLLLSLLHCRYHHTTQQLNYMYALAIMRDYERRQGERAINRGSTVDPVYGKVSGLQVQPV